MASDLQLQAAVHGVDLLLRQVGAVAAAFREGGAHLVVVVVPGVGNEIQKRIKSKYKTTCR